jgi:DNA-binding MarR family transcriptional regulator
MDHAQDATGSATPNGAVELEEFQRAAELRRRLRRFLAHGDAAVRRCGLTPQRYLLLLAVKGAPDGTQTRTIGDVADDLQLAQSSATELVDRAEASGLVVRMASPHDGRVVRIKLSPAGEERLARAFGALSRDRLQLLEHLDHARMHLAEDGHGAAGA